MPPSTERTRVLTASEDAAVHTTIARALALLGHEDAEKLQLVRADTAAETLAVAAAEQPSIAFLDVTIGAGAGIGLVHFLPATVPGLVVVAIVPEGADHDVRLVEQAASLGAAWVLLGELTGDDVLRAFSRVAPSFSRSVPPPDFGNAPPQSESTLARNAKIADARSFTDLDLILANVEADVSAVEVRAAVERCLAHERQQRATMQDATTSAYSFAYFVDLAGREIDLARRHGRRFALATIELDAPTVGLVPAPAIDARAAIELVLGAVRDTDIVARAEENELLLLLPETGAKGARTLRRRVLDRVFQHVRASSREAGRIASPALPVRVGIASFPFDGEDLSRLLRIARRRAARWAPYDAPTSVQALLVHAIEWLADPRRGAQAGIGPLRPLDAPLRDAWALLDTLVRESTRAGDATIALHAPPGASESALGLAQGIRASTLDAIGPSSGTNAQRTSDRDVLSMITGGSRLAESAKFGGFEMVSILAEHACYGLLGRVDDGRLFALHGHDLPVVEAMVMALEQPVLRRSSAASSSSSNLSSAVPTSARSSRSDSSGLRRG